MPNTKVVGIIFPYILTPIPNLYDHSFPRYGQITFLTFRRPTTLTFDLKFWKIFVSHGVPIRNMYAKFHNDRLRNGWDITLWNFAKTRTNKQTDRQTWALQYLALPLRGRGNYLFLTIMWWERTQFSNSTFWRLVFSHLWFRIHLQLDFVSLVMNFWTTRVRTPVSKMFRWRTYNSQCPWRVTILVHFNRHSMTICNFMDYYS